MKTRRTRRTHPLLQKSFEGLKSYGRIAWGMFLLWLFLAALATTFGIGWIHIWNGFIDFQILAICLSTLGHI